MEASKEAEKLLGDVKALEKTLMGKMGNLNKMLKEIPNANPIERKQITTPHGKVFAHYTQSGRVVIEFDDLKKAKDYFNNKLK